MKTIITRIKRLALALCFVTPLVSWAANSPTATVDGTSVTISNESGAESWDNATLSPLSNYQNKTFTVPAIGTDVPAGTILKVSSVSFAKSTSATAYPAKIKIAGCVSAAATVTSGGFTTASADKITYSFGDGICLLKAGTASQIAFLDANGVQLTSGGSFAFRLGYNAYQFVGSVVWASKVPIVEIAAEVVDGYVDFEASSGNGWGFESGSGSGKVYVSGYKNYMKTPGSNEKEIVLTDGTYGYAFDIKEANSMSSQNPNQITDWAKISGDGTLTTASANSSRLPFLLLRDTSDFTGTINATASCKLTTVFCGTSETFDDRVLYNKLFANYTGSMYVTSERSTSNSNVVTIPAGKTWTGTALLNEGETVIDGTFAGSVVNSGKLTINGTVTGMISGSGTVVVNEGATVSSISSQRDFTGWTIDSSIPVKITMTPEEYGKGSVSVTGANGISSIPVLAPDGTTEVGTITLEAGAGTLETGVKTTGLATWCDYEFKGDKSNSGTDTTGLTSDVNTTTYPEIFNSSMLYTYTHPWRDISYPNSWTAVVRCTVPELENAVVVMFGTYSAGAIGLVAGSNPEEEMLLVSTPGSTATTSEAKHFTTLATMNVKDATTAQHVYVFTKDGTTVNVYCDGEKVLDNYELASATLGGGLQVGSLHGGVVQGEVHTGLVRFGAGESQISSLTLAQQQNARIDCMRMFDYIVSPEQIAALSVDFPAVKLYRATVAENAETSWTDLTWTPAWDGGNTQSKVILTTEGGATVALPASITVDEVQLALAEGSTLTLSGPGSLAVTQPITIEDGTLELTGTVTFTQDTTFNGSVVFNQFTKEGDGAIKLANGATVGVDAALVVTPLGTYTCAEGTVADAAYSSGEGDVKLIPLTDAVVSITQGETTLYYSDLDTAVGLLVEPGTISDDVVVTLLNGTTWPTTPVDYAGMLRLYGYYIDDNGILTKAVARILTTMYPTLAAAVGAAADGATVGLLRASSEEIALNDKAITLSETANFSGTLTGNGTLTFAAFRNNPSITFDNWTGTVVLPSFAAAATVINKYGVAGSTVVLKGITGGWLGETSAQKMDVAPVLQLDGNVTIKGFSPSWDYTFAELAGTGNFVLDPTDNNPLSVTITKVAEDFSGIITNNTDKVLTITTLAREAETSTDVGTKLLDIGGTGEIVVGAVTIGGEPADVYLVYEEDGVYVGVPPVEINPSAVVINYNSYATLSVVGGSLEGATYGWTMYTNGVACSSLSGPVKISSGKTKATVKVYSENTAFDNVVAKVAITNGEDVIEREATITVADVAARVGETEYTKAQLEEAAADAIANGKTLQLYTTGPKVTLQPGQTLVSQAVCDRNTPTPSVSAPAGTAELVYSVVKTIDNATKTYTYTLESDTPAVMFTAAADNSVEYLDASFKVSKAGTYKLLKSFSRGQLTVGNVAATLDLNGQTMTSTVSGSKGAIYVDTLLGSASLAIVDSAGGGKVVAENCYTIWANRNATVAIEAGEFTGSTHVVYLSNAASSVAISGGVFKMASGSAAYMLNMLDSARGTITVTGGTFTGFNPANNAAEGAGTNFLADGYEATETSTGVWTVDVTDPTIGGETVEPAKVFDTATTAEGIVYPKAPTVSGEPGSQTITYKGTVVEVPAYYTATLFGTTVMLALNSNALPTIGATEASGDDEAVPATEVTDETFGLGLTTTSTKLYYGLATCDTPSGTFAEPTTLTQGTGKAMSLKANRGTNENVKFYKVFVTDIAPVAP